MSELFALLGTGGTSVPTPTLDGCSGRVCQDDTTSIGCGTISGCTDTGEQYRWGWNETGCNDSYHHIALHWAVDGGSYYEVGDNVACNATESDAGCCEFPEATYDGEWQKNDAFNAQTTCTTSYNFRVRVETDGTDTAIDTCTSGSGTGCDTTCVL